MTVTIKETHGQKRAQLCHLPTPLQPLNRLSDELGGPRIWIKRDDCTGLAMGGNKARKLEYVVPQAIAEGADTLVTIGAMQSNHVRQTVAAAAVAGMECWVVLGNWVGHEQDSYLKSGNRLLDEILGARIFEPAGEETPEQSLARVADLVRAQGRTPYIVEIGASTSVGALGYVDCVQEILAHFSDVAIEPSAVYFASGSGGTQAGMLAATSLLNSPVVVQGVSVFQEDAPALRETIAQIATGTLELLGRDDVISPEAVQLDESELAPGYGLPNESMLEALKLLARLEAVILDPVYTGKAMAGLIRDVRAGRFHEDEHIVFVHTGGAPGLFAYSDIINFD